MMFCLGPFRSLTVVGSTRVYDDQQRFHSGQFVYSRNGRHNRTIQR